MPKSVLIMGAAGRDFHNFNVFFRDNKEYKVVAFTATQIPDITERRYPPELAGELYKDGIPIYTESELTKLIKKLKVDIVVFAYSDVTHNHVMHAASTVLATGADFMLLGPKSTMIESKKPLIAVCAVRTGSGKSQTSRKIADILKKYGKRVVFIRHPMPYGDLAIQAVQRFATYEDIDEEKCTIEEREEYEPIIDKGMVVYAGVDYGAILRKAEEEADIILWDGGNNDFPFYKYNLLITVADPLRAGHELLYHPGETNLRMADIIVINKMDSAKEEDIGILKNNIKKVNPDATLIFANSTIKVDNPDVIRNKRVLVIEDGPTVTHGGMAFGAGSVAAKRNGVKEIVDVKPYAVGTIKETYKKYPKTSIILPAMGYSKQQVKDLEETIAKVPCDSVVVGTPIDITKVIKIQKPFTRVKYKLEEIGKPDLEEILLKTVLKRI